MKLEFRGWKSRGLRSPDMEIDLCPDGRTAPRVTLIQMPNGTGKTTTKTCMQAALTGEAMQWSEEQVAALASSTGGLQSGEFELRLGFDDRPLTFTMNFDFLTNTVSYGTTFNRGRNDKYAPPPALRRFLNPHFTRLLVFDGELPGALLDSTKTDAQEAMDAFFQLYLLDDLSAAVGDMWHEATKNVTAKQQKGEARRRNEVVQISNKLEGLQRVEQKIHKRLVVLDASLASIREEIGARLDLTEQLRGDKEELVGELGQADLRLERAQQSLLAGIREPALLNSTFLLELVELRDNLERLKLPETTSRQFFEELAEEDVCICDREMTPAARSAVEARAETFLAHDVVGKLNVLKHAVKVIVEREVDSTLEGRAQEVRETIHARDGLKSAQEALIATLAAQGDVRLGELQAEQIKQKKEQMGLAVTRDELVRKPTTEERERARKGQLGDHDCIALCELSLKRAKHNLAEISDTLRLKHQTETLQAILARAKELARERLTEHVIEEMNTNLDVLLAGHNIRVAGVGSSLLLDQQAGASLGQTLALGYSFLTTLFGRGQHEFPFIVDAPVTALDTRVSREVGRLIPKVCHQFVAFILDRERPGFVDSLAHSSNNDIQYLTAFEDSPRNKELIDLLPEAGVVRTRNGIVVAGLDYFNKVDFHEDNSSNSI